MGEGVWRLEGLDTFDGGPYIPLGKKEGYSSEGEVLEAAQEQLRLLEESQPTEQSGGQSEFGIQDQVFVVDPDGNRRRVIPNSVLF